MLFQNKFKYFVLFCLITLLMLITTNRSAFGESPNAEIEDIIVPPSTKLGDPDYDSGWVDLGTSPDPISLDFTHHQGGDPEDYLIDLTCKDSSIGVNNCTDTGFVTNAHWYDLTDEKVSVYADTFSVDAVRVRIYKARPAFDSGWRENPEGFPFSDIDIKVLLGDDPRGYFLDLECRHGTPFGIYDCIDNNFDFNAQWHGLTSTSVTARVVSTLPDDVRVRIYQLDQPTQPASDYYDSGWDVIGIRPDPISISFDHNLGGDIDNYFVALECYDDSSLAIYNCSNMKFKTNAQWYDLSDTSIQVHVWGGSQPDKLRIRIWKVPLISNFDAAPTSGLEPLEVQFRNLSTGYKECLWNFGDGLMSSDCDDPKHTYTSGGLYSVHLTVANDVPPGDLHTKTDYIHVDFGTYLPVILR